MTRNRPQYLAPSTFSAQGVLSLAASVDISSAIITNDNGTPHLDASWSAAFKTSPAPVLASNMKVPPTPPNVIKLPDHNDARFYPITLNVRLANAVSGPSDFKIVGQTVKAVGNDLAAPLKEAPG